MPKWQSKPDKPGIYVWGVAKVMDKFNQKAEDLWVAIHGVESANNTDSDKNNSSVLAMKDRMGFKTSLTPCGACLYMGGEPWNRLCTWPSDQTNHFPIELEFTCSMWKPK